MKRYVAMAIIIFGALFAASVSVATIYKYVDDQGEEIFTNDLSSVPADKLNQVTEMPEVESDQQPPAPKYSGPIYPLLQQSPSAEQLAKQKKLKQKKQRLEAEYQRLLKEKEALDNDKSFQTRRHKYKYKHRPYIIALEKKEAEINQRLADLKRQLDAF